MSHKVFIIRAFITFLSMLLFNLIYLSFWAYVFTGDAYRVSFASETPFAVIGAALAPMIYVTHQSYLDVKSKTYLNTGFIGLICLILFVMALEKYSFIFPDARNVFYYHAIDPVIFTIATMAILRGIDGGLILLKKP